MTAGVGERAECRYEPRRSGISFLTLWMLLVLSTLTAQYWRTGNNFSVSEILLGISVAVLVIGGRAFPGAWCPRSRALPVFLMIASLWLFVHLVWALPSGAGELAAAKDLATFSYLLVALGLLRRVNSGLVLRVVPWFLVGVSLLLWLQLVLDGTARARGLFYDPNLPGSLAATLIIGMIALSSRNTWVPVAIGSLAASHALLLTNSMSAFVGVVPAVAYLMMHRARPIVKFVGVVGAGFVANYAVPLLASLVSEERFESSRQGRISIWQEVLQVWEANPMGIGALTLRLPNIGIFHVVDTHNEYLHALVAFGPIGLLVLIGLFIALARLGKERTLAMVIYLAITSITINALNFRNIWLLLALMVMLDAVSPLGHTRRSTAYEVATVGNPKLNPEPR